MTLLTLCGWLLFTPRERRTGCVFRENVIPE